MRYRDIISLLSVCLCICLSTLHVCHTSFKANIFIWCDNKQHMCLATHFSAFKRLVTDSLMVPPSIYIPRTYLSKVQMHLTLYYVHTNVDKCVVAKTGSFSRLLTTMIHQKFTPLRNVWLLNFWHHPLSINQCIQTDRLFEDGGRDTGVWPSYLVWPFM